MPPLPWRTRQAVDPDNTYILTITRLPLRSHLRIPRIVHATLAITRELKSSDGLVGYSLKADLIAKTFWTASAWEDDDSLADFVQSKTHLAAMAALQPHMADARIKTLTVAGHDLPPSWKDIAHSLTPADTTTPSRRHEHA